MKAFFRALAATMKDKPTAQAVSGIGILGLAVYTGYTIPRPSMCIHDFFFIFFNPFLNP